MKVKTYRAKGFITYSLMVTVGGKLTTVNFGFGSYSPRLYASLRTSDEALQKALEKHPSFGKRFILENTEYIAEAAPKKAAEDKPLEFNNFNELRDYLIREHQKAPIIVSTMAKADREMQKLGIKYIIK